MTPEQFVEKWTNTELTERAASHEHFIDLCRILGVSTPAEADPQGIDYCFEKSVQVVGAASKGSKGDSGFVDVWKRGCFGWEYKRKDKYKDLSEAYRQLYQYRDALDNPPLSVVCDINTIQIHTHFTGYPRVTQTIALAELPSKLNTLLRVFEHPETFRPEKTRTSVTKDVADEFGKLADSLINRFTSGKKDPDAHKVAHFLMKVMFCLFVEDIHLLPADTFTRLVKRCLIDPESFPRRAGELFGKMRTGGDYGNEIIPWFNGGLFDDLPPMELKHGDVMALNRIAEKDWSGVEPSIFGTLFERILDPAKRAQIGAHYTSKEDIMLVIEPVIMQPLRRELTALQDDLKPALDAYNKETSEKRRRTLSKPITDKLDAFRRKLGTLRVLDPACGSGNFLYVALQELLELDNQLVRFAATNRLGLDPKPYIRPSQLHGIEINPYAAELAQVVVWIGYLQWLLDRGIDTPKEPILDKLQTIENRDAILDLSDPKHPMPAKWPEADFIVGNPPFLGSKMFRRSGLSDAYIASLYATFTLSKTSDLCCYWFDLGCRAIRSHESVRVGLLATQGIRGRENRRVLEDIRESGAIFLAHSDRDWVLDGAAVHVSIVAFDSGLEKDRLLDGRPVDEIFADLTAGADLTVSKALPENKAVRWSVGTQKGGDFDLELATARTILSHPCPNGRRITDVVRPWVSGMDLTARIRGKWIVYFPPDMPEGNAAAYEPAYEYARTNVKPFRDTVRRDAYRKRWWIHQEAREGLDEALSGLQRFIVTPMVTKHRIYTWACHPAIPDKQITVFVSEDDYMMGTLHSSLHECWARMQGTQLREAESGFRYTPTTCFETFALPWPPGKESVKHPAYKRISEAAKELNVMRERWLNPPEWIEPLAKRIDAADDFSDVPADARALIRHSAIMAAAAKDARLKKRTLTNLYNERPTWLKLAHEKLDRAVLAAYAATDPSGGWSEDWASVWTDTGAGQPLPVEHPLRSQRLETDQRVLANLLRLNCERAGIARPPSPAIAPDLQYERSLDDPKLVTALAEYRNGLRELYSNRLERVVLFGSRARGSAAASSDADVLIVLNGRFSYDAEIERTGKLTAEVSLRHGVRISRGFMTKAEADARNTLLQSNIRRDGVTL